MQMFRLYLKGYAEICVTGTSCERFFNLCVNHNMDLYRIAYQENGFTAIMTVNDFLKIKRLVKKCQVHVTVKRKYGVPFLLRQHRKRRLFLLGGIWCCFFLYLLSLHIWKIEINGNQEITREQLMNYLAEKQITYGCVKKKIDCKETAAEIRNAFPLVTWVAVKKQGTMLEISIKENTDGAQAEEKTKAEMEMGGSSLTACYDGKIVDIVTRSGIPQVSEGDLVQKGDVLVSGVIPITNDAEEVTACHYVDADADVIMEVSVSYTDQFSRKITRSVYEGKMKKNWYLKLFHHTFALGKTEQQRKSAEILVKEQQLTIGEDFYLPLTVGTVTTRTFRKEESLLSKSETEELARKRLEKFIAEKREKGVQILKKNVRIDTGVTICTCTGSYAAYVSDMERIPAMQMENSKEGTFS